MDETIRKPDLPSNDQRTAVPQDVTSTIRVDSPQSSSANGDITVRPGATATNDKNGATDFVLYMKEQLILHVGAINLTAYLWQQN